MVNEDAGDALHSGRPVEELVALALRDNQSAWKAIVDRYAALVWSVCSSFRLSQDDAADVSQTVWLHAVEHLSSLRNAAALPGWLKTTTRNECLKVVSAAKRTTSGSATLLESRADIDSPELDAALLAAEKRAAIREGFAQLPRHCQRLLHLLMTEDRPSYAEISTRLDMPVGSIGPNRSRCLDKLSHCPALVRWLES